MNTKTSQRYLISVLCSFLVFLTMPDSMLGQNIGRKTCLECHINETPGIVSQWESSKHGEAGVECNYCHNAAQSDTDAFEHYGNTIAVIVSPLDCSQCHDKEYNEQRGSHHAKAGEILGSLDNLLGEVLGGEPAVVTGCRQCHGSKVRVDDSGHPTSDTWPNTGMGRINPDGSRGSCSACHTRHEFSKAQARQPEACGKCHLGPDHPQIEIWNESKHGILYHANREKINLEADTWQAGEDYFTGPTCSSCHMSAGGTQEVTHDVGERISWTLRPVISKKLNMVVYSDGDKEDVLGDNPELPKSGAKHPIKDGTIREVKAVHTWGQRREAMKDICSQCHAMPFVNSFYNQFDNLVDLYNTKFAEPSQAIISALRAENKITQMDFDDSIEWTFWELWHHEGRRARHGASMMGPDYTWWHGIYEVAKHFYGKFIPQMLEIAGEELSQELLNKYVYSQDGHLWFKEGYSSEVREKINNFYRERYQQ